MTNTTAAPTVAVRRPPASAVVAIGLVWAAAVAAHATGHARLLDHDALLGTGRVSYAAVLVFAAAWTVMVAAMMLPSAVPLMRLYAATSVSPPRPRMLLAVFGGHYVAVWTISGRLALAFDSGVHRTVDAWPWLDSHQSLVAASTLGLRACSSSAR